MTIKEVFEFYQEYIKRIYSEIEAKRNDIPVELLFETYASFDHIKRFYLDEEDEQTASIKALSHLKRGVLDAFKLKLKYFNQDVEEFQKHKADFDLIDNGSFISEFYKKKNEIYKIAKEARLTESKSSKEDAFEKWFEVSLKIDDFEDKFLNNLEKIEWAKQKTFKWLNKDSFRGFAVGIVSGVLSSLVVYWITL